MKREYAFEDIGFEKWSVIAPEQERLCIYRRKFYGSFVYRLSAKVVSAETAKIQGDAAFVADGTLKDFFGLETQLAEKFAKAMGKEAPALQIEYHEEKNLMALKLFGEGLVKLQEAEALLGPLALDNPPAAPADATGKEGTPKKEETTKSEPEPKKAP